MDLLALPAFADNYIWLLHDGKDALVVDPGDAAPVQAALAQHGLQLRHILITHHHHDHIGGLAAWLLCCMNTPPKCGRPNTRKFRRLCLRAQR